MLVSKLRALGGSVVVTLPKDFLRSMDLSANDTVGMTLLDGRLVIEPRPRPRYSLCELMAQCHFDVPRSEEEAAWLHEPSRGSEAI
jgi:antitoxin ChpS